MKKYFVSISLILCSFTTFAAVNCEGEIKNQSIREDIKVKKNCQLEGLIVHGNVILENGAMLNCMTTTSKAILNRIKILPRSLPIITISVAMLILRQGKISNSSITKFQATSN